MSNIQDIRALETRIMDIVEDYIRQVYNEDDVLTISCRQRKTIVEVAAPETDKVGKETEKHPLQELVRMGDDGKPEADFDKISEIANSWLFLD
ncbi:MAG: hypothetical protein IJ722_07070 [Alloprevotella sp.]|nr:hypothetical protein [Alloprevotella sp.]